MPPQARLNRTRLQVYGMAQRTHLAADQSHKYRSSYFHFVLAGNAAQKWPESLTQKRRNHRPAFFGAENSVEMRAHVRHANHSAVPSGLNAMPVFPALKRRAILMMSLRDKERAPRNL